MLHDSMVTVRLSEPPALTVDTTSKRRSRKIEEADEDRNSNTHSIAETDGEDQSQEESPRITMMDPNGNEVTSPTGSESGPSEAGESRRGSDSSKNSTEGVNWEELGKTEEKEPRDQDSDDVSLFMNSPGSPLIG